MNRTIWLVRHGERADNIDPEWRANGALPRGVWDDPPLSNHGHIQATEVGAKLSLEAEPVDYIFCSPFTRCLQTTENIVGRLRSASKTPRVFVEPGFCESLNVTQNPPGFMELKEIRSSFPTLAIDLGYTAFLDKKTLLEEKNREVTNNCCFGRVHLTLQHIFRHYSNGNFLIVSHGSPIAGCHFSLAGGDKAYPGQCTISKYVLSTENNKENTDLVSTNDSSGDRSAEACCKSEASEEVSAEVKMPKSGTDEENVPSSVKVVRMPGWRCMYAGDKSHLSDQTRNLRDRIL